MSTADADRRLETLAASIADGSPVTWDQPDRLLTPREEHLVRNLRLIDTLAGVFRSLPPAGDQDEPSDPATEDPAGPRWGRLILLDRVGQGASADVFRA